MRLALRAELAPQPASKLAWWSGARTHVTSHVPSLRPTALRSARPGWCPGLRKLDHRARRTHSRPSAGSHETRRATSAGAWWTGAFAPVAGRTGLRDSSQAVPAFACALLMRSVFRPRCLVPARTCSSRWAEAEARLQPPAIAIRGEERPWRQRRNVVQAKLSLQF